MLKKKFLRQEKISVKHLQLLTKNTVVLVVACCTAREFKLA